MGAHGAVLLSALCPDCRACPTCPAGFLAEDFDPLSYFCQFPGVLIWDQGLIPLCPLFA
jgi:hypothetical protein